MNSTEMELDEFGDYLRKIAEKETATVLAKRLGISRSTLYLIMDRGAWPPKKVCKLLGVSFLVPAEGEAVKRRKAKNGNL